MITNRFTEGEMDNNAIFENVRRFLKKYTSNVDISENQEIFTKGLINSLLAMQMVLFLEKEYNFEISNEDLDIKNFNTLNSIANFVCRKKSKLEGELVS